jgi:hypothetical protein
MTEDERCCGTGTCIINAEGECWCGQIWDGAKMCRPSNAQDEDHETIKKASQAKPEKLIVFGG